jgi:hypothetical protein
LLLGDRFVDGGEFRIAENAPCSCRHIHPWICRSKGGKGDLILWLQLCESHHQQV